ncbi:MAG: hypothetical protein ACK5VT_06820 [Alphaproteobacteria bacterium]
MSNATPVNPNNGWKPRQSMPREGGGIRYETIDANIRAYVGAQKLTPTERRDRAQRLIADLEEKNLFRNNPREEARLKAALKDGVSESELTQITKVWFIKVNNIKDLNGRDCDGETVPYSRALIRSDKTYTLPQNILNKPFQPVWTELPCPRGGCVPEVAIETAQVVLQPETLTRIVETQVQVPQWIPAQGTRMGFEGAIGDAIVTFATPPERAAAQGAMRQGFRSDASQGRRIDGSVKVSDAAKANNERGTYQRQGETESRRDLQSDTRILERESRRYVEVTVDYQNGKPVLIPGQANRFKMELTPSISRDEDGRQVIRVGGGAVISETAALNPWAKNHFTDERTGYTRFEKDQYLSTEGGVRAFTHYQGITQILKGIPAHEKSGTPAFAGLFEQYANAAVNGKPQIAEQILNLHAHLAANPDVRSLHQRFAGMSGVEIGKYVDEVLLDGKNGPFKDLPESQLTALRGKFGSQVIPYANPQAITALVGRKIAAGEDPLQPLHQFRAGLDYVQDGVGGKLGATTDEDKKSRTEQYFTDMRQRVYAAVTVAPGPEEYRLAQGVYDEKLQQTQVDQFQGRDGVSRQMISSFTTPQGATKLLDAMAEDPRVAQAFASSVFLATKAPNHASTLGFATAGSAFGDFFRRADANDVDKITSARQFAGELTKAFTAFHGEDAEATKKSEAMLVHQNPNAGLRGAGDWALRTATIGLASLNDPNQTRALGEHFQAFAGEVSAAAKKDPSDPRVVRALAFIQRVARGAEQAERGDVAHMLLSPLTDAQLYATYQNNVPQAVTDLRQTITGATGMNESELAQNLRVVEHINRGSIAPEIERAHERRAALTGVQPVQTATTLQGAPPTSDVLRVTQELLSGNQVIATLPESSARTPQAIVRDLEPKRLLQGVALDGGIAKYAIHELAQDRGNRAELLTVMQSNRAQLSQQAQTALEQVEKIAVDLQKKDKKKSAQQCHQTAAESNAFAQMFKGALTPGDYQLLAANLTDAQAQKLQGNDEFATRLVASQNTPEKREAFSQATGVPAAELVSARKGINDAVKIEIKEIQVLATGLFATNPVVDGNLPAAMIAGANIGTLYTAGQQHRSVVTATTREAPAVSVNLTAQLLARDPIAAGTFIAALKAGEGQHQALGKLLAGHVERMQEAGGDSTKQTEAARVLTDEVKTLLAGNTPQALQAVQRMGELIATNSNLTKAYAGSMISLSEDAAQQVLGAEGLTRFQALLAAKNQAGLQELLAGRAGISQAEIQSLLAGNGVSLWSAAELAAIGLGFYQVTKTCGGGNPGIGDSVKPVNPPLTDPLNPGLPGPGVPPVQSPPTPLPLTSGFAKVCTSTRVTPLPVIGVVALKWVTDYHATRGGDETNLEAASFQDTPVTPAPKVERSH